MDPSLNLLYSILIPALISLAGVLAGVYTARLSYRQRREELEDQQRKLKAEIERDRLNFLAQAAEQTRQSVYDREQLTLLKEQVEQKTAELENDRARLRIEIQTHEESILTPEERAVRLVETLLPPEKADPLEEWPFRSPYIVGLPVSDPQLYFRDLDGVSGFFDRVLGPHLNCLSILGARRSGKTSFLKYLCHPQNRAQQLNPDETRRLLLVNLNLQSGISGVNPFYRKLLLETCAAVQRQRDCADQPIHAPELVTDQIAYAFFKKMREQGWRILLLLDEFEKLGQLPVFDTQFFDFLRSLSNDSEGQIAWVTTSYREIHTIQPQDGNRWTSDFFNLFGQMMKLGSIGDTDARSLISVPAERAGHPLEDPADIEFLIELAGRMPFPLQAAASILYGCHREGLSGAPARQQTRHLFSENMRKYYEHYWLHFTLHERSVLQAAAEGNPIPTGQSPSLRSLIDYGFVLENGQVSGSGFQEWIREGRMQVP